MDAMTRKTVVVFTRPFTVRGVGETFPAGEYAIETELACPPGHLSPDSWKASVLVRLHPRATHPGLARTLTLSVDDLEQACEHDTLTGRQVSDAVVEEMLADPISRLAMMADGVSEAYVRQLYSARKLPEGAGGSTGSNPMPRKMQDSLAIEAAENEGMPPRRKRPVSGRASVVAVSR